MSDRLVLIWTWTDIIYNVWYQDVNSPLPELKAIYIDLILSVCQSFQYDELTGWENHPPKRTHLTEDCQTTA